MEWMNEYMDEWITFIDGKGLYFTVFYCNINEYLVFYITCTSRGLNDDFQTDQKDMAKCLKPLNVQDLLTLQSVPYTFWIDGEL
jgi:hypothetical protein